jgi:hypothetical protein
MSGLISFAKPITASRKVRATRDTFQACRDRASADLLKSVTMLTANERVTLERSAASWSLRADMLEDLARRAPRHAPGESSEQGGTEHFRL